MLNYLMVELLMHQGGIFMEAMELRPRGPPLKSHMQPNPLEEPWAGDYGKYLLNLWKQEVFLSLEATENVTKI